MSALAQAPSVSFSAEFERILKVPRRDVPPEDAVFPTPDFRTDFGRREGAELLPIQSRMLYEMYHARGLFAAVPVGDGKTLPTWLAPVVLGSRRPYLILPASVAKEKTRGEFAKYARHWITPQPPPTVFSYSALTLQKNLTLLDEVQPDLLIFDEAHKIRNFDKSAAQRLDRYIERTGIPVVVLTGTIMRKSIRDFAHLIRWALKDNCPTPKTDDDLWQWCQALDEDSKVGIGRWAPGAILDCLEPMPDAQGRGVLARARSAVRRRIAETPGVVSKESDSCDMPLEIDFAIAPHDAAIEAAFDHLFSTGEAWDGWPLEETLTIHAYREQAGCGFFYYHDPRPPDEWMRRRREWCAVCREDIEKSRKTSNPRDTEGAVKSFHRDHPALKAWEEIEPTFIPNTVQHWLSASVVWAAAQIEQHWRERGECSLIWTDQQAVAQGLASVTGIPYYGALGMRIDAHGRTTKDSVERIVLDGKGRPTHSAILSIDANREGRNLQAYNRNISVGWEAAVDRVEQRLGRTHRRLQTRPVYETILMTSSLTRDAFFATMGEARYVQEQFGYTQKILKAKIRHASLPTSGARWASREEIAEIKENRS